MSDGQARRYLQEHCRPFPYIRFRMAIAVACQLVLLLISQCQGQGFRHSIPPQSKVKVKARALPDLIIKDHQRVRCMLLLGGSQHSMLGLERPEVPGLRIRSRLRTPRRFLAQAG